ncbi:hypothetical protein IQ07DRAFT_668319 [Pyrenochaeta sp. DS3sAY3a]|nr:hypothetical protein IQ07DRAFT_668319 [Pyrenochaeta sp. DS3sAY3a]
MSFARSFRTNDRGRFARRRGDGRGDGRSGRNLTYKKEQIKPDIVKHPLGKLLETILASDSTFLVKDLGRTVTITDCRYLASYNWLNRSAPTIAVPGRPPQWTPLKYPQRLRRDSGEYFRDPNTARYPDYPTAPGVQAVLDTNSEFLSTEVDLFACGSTLGSLLRFVRGMDKAFRFNVEVIGHTVFFVRRHNDPKELIPDVKGYGHTFPEAYTTWDRDVKGSETHQRIVQYNFGELKCVVRFECDGYILSLAATNDLASVEGTKDTLSKTTPDMDGLLQALSDSAVAPDYHSTIPTKVSFVVEKGGVQIPQRTLFDLKTRSSRYNREIDMSDIYPSLWLKQIPNFIVAYHDGDGLFEQIHVNNIEEKIHEWEKVNAQHIHRLNLLLERITSIAKASASGLLDVYFAGEGALEIHEQYGEATHALPVDLMNRWESQEGESEGVNSNASDRHENGSDDGYNLKIGIDSDWASNSDSDEPDYTACSAEDCGYCGKCTY